MIPSKGRQLGNAEKWGIEQSFDWFWIDSERRVFREESVLVGSHRFARKCGLQICFGFRHEVLLVIIWHVSEKDDRFSGNWCCGKKNIQIFIAHQLALIAHIG